MTEVLWRDRLRALPVFSGALPHFDPDSVPADPTALLNDWLELALQADVSQPHAMSLATVSSAGEPAVRTLLLKDVTPAGLWFAALSSAPKGRDLEANPRAAIVLYWREQGRQIRVVGDVERGSPEIARIDFLKRHPNARAIATAGQQSEPLPATDAEYEAAVSDSRARIDANPDYVPDDWTAYLLRPVEYEFWQAARERDQLRLRYRRSDHGWMSELLWP